jgi:hypothetical protein
MTIIKKESIGVNTVKWGVYSDGKPYTYFYQEVDIKNHWYLPTAWGLERFYSRKALMQYLRIDDYKVGK